MALVEEVIRIYRGDTYNKVIDVELPTPIDVNDYTVTAQYRPQTDSPDEDAVDFTVTTAVVDTSYLRSYLSLSTAQTRALPGPGLWDMQIAFEDGRVVTVVGGEVQVRDDVTR